MTVNDAVAFTLRLPVIVTLACDATADVLIVKVPLVWPDGMVMLAGTVATAVFDELRVTTAPLWPAADVSVAVPVAVLPPVTLPGEMVMVESLTAAEAGTEARRMRNNGTSRRTKPRHCSLSRLIRSPYCGGPMPQGEGIARTAARL